MFSSAAGPTMRRTRWLLIACVIGLGLPAHLASQPPAPPKVPANPPPFRPVPGPPRPPPRPPWFLFVQPWLFIVLPAAAAAIKRKREQEEEEEMTPHQLDSPPSLAYKIT